MDTCCKLLEISRSLLGRNAICDALVRDLSGALSLANSKYHEWKTVYEPRHVIDTYEEVCPET
jgi:hypothetical protein